MKRLIRAGRAGTAQDAVREVALVEVLDHRDLELPRQADDGRRRQEGHGDPARAEGVRPVERSRRVARAKIASSPPPTPQTTKTPTAISATSLTTASNAIAATTPWCRSLASTLRVPNRMVNSAIPAAIQSRRDAGVRLGAAIGPSPEDLDACHRLELQRDVGRGGDDRDQRHQHRQRLELLP